LLPWVDDVIYPVRVWDTDGVLYMDVPKSASVQMVKSFQGDFICPMSDPRGCTRGITFKVENGWSFEDVARRLTDLVYGSHEKTFTGPNRSGVEDKDTTRYQIGSMNNMWLHLTHEDDTYILNTRYGLPPGRYMWLTASLCDIFRADIVSNMQLHPLRR